MKQEVSLKSYHDYIKKYEKENMEFFNDETAKMCDKLHK